MANDVEASGSEQSRRFAELSAATRVRMPGLELLTVRDIFEALGQTAGAEPEGIAYAELGRWVRAKLAQTVPNS